MNIKINKQKPQELMGVLLSAVDKVLANKFQLFIDLYWLHGGMSAGTWTIKRLTRLHLNLVTS